MSLQCQGDEGLPVGLAAGKRGQLLDRSEGARSSGDAESLRHQVTECLGINVRASDEGNQSTATFGIVECDDGAVAHVRISAQLRLDRGD